MSIQKEETVTSEEIFAGRVIRVLRDEVLLENGLHATREVVRHNGGAAVIAIDENDDITMIRQYRYASGCTLCEIPAGKLEKGENPFAAAKRELEEEAGIIAAEYYDMGYIIPTCGYCDEKIYLYAAKGLTHTAQHLDADEFVSVYTLPLAEAVQQVLKNEITDGKTVAAILKLRLLRDAKQF